jgi:hypothetical protein
MIQYLFVYMMMVIQIHTTYILMTDLLLYIYIYVGVIQNQNILKL